MKLEKVKPNLYTRLLSVLLDKEMHREALARKLGTKTGNIKKHLNELLYEGYVKIRQEKNTKVYSLTDKGRMISLQIKSIELASNLSEEEKIRKLNQIHYNFMHDVTMVLGGELFDPRVAGGVDGNMPFSKRLHDLILTIPPGIPFTLDDLCRECRKYFPDEDIKKVKISTCIKRFRDEDNVNYIPNLKNYKNGTYVLE